MTAHSNDWTEEEKELLEKQIFTALEQVIDPELGIDIVNLGLIYDIALFENGRCVISMTLTTMGCPLFDVIHEEILKAMEDVPAITETEVKLVWYPAWDTSKMSRYARIALGIR
ncbi:metal-sulfur cluster assembly factor [Pisciglobus halotolerans]|uniref:Metal-sulfur cluster biosynthetic enzyme n=1 Tax=Pisciglobus halotolerans TaxID=745365 RepID=A0A1I3CHR9_9LACT|nr:metal-sulfur cluster assembly factor [Pisciglobus halotolerans]SFH74124.1 Metal-sulfur cluster biosynthetic enzyme [Pisciglobus halotolerans]